MPVRMISINVGYPSYASTKALDELRAKEYPALASHTYLDFTAANLYASSQIARHVELLQRQLLGNPHSTNPSSSLATEHVARVRRAILRFFNASPDEWEVIFAANASQALKLIGESYPFGAGDRFLLCSDGLTNVVGDAEIAEELATAPPRDAALRLRDHVLARGAPDNVTIIIIHAEPAS